MKTGERHTASAARRERETGEIVRSIRIIRSAHRRYSAELEKKYRMTGQQVGVLAIVARRPGVSVGELASRMFLHISTCSGIVDRLERKGYVARRRDRRDRRIVSLHLTPRGRRTIDRIPIASFGMLMREIRKLPAGEIHRLHGAMMILLRVMELDVDSEKEVADER